jgi:protein-tyrosine phosphatase
VIDLHCHILPGVDDGAPTLDEAVEMCRLAAADGCRALIATPHQRHPDFPNEDSRSLEAKLRELRAAVGKGLDLHLGAEVRVDSELLGDLEGEPPRAVTPLAGGRYLLLELPHVESLSPPAEEIVHELTIAGWRPILAHPELLQTLGGDLSRLRRLVAAGALLQVTAQSVIAGFGRQVEVRVWQMLEAGLVHFVASDAHGVRWRPPGLSRVREQLRIRLGEEEAHRLTSEHPRQVLEDLPLRGETKRSGNPGTWHPS